jgi:FOG: PKD repeat
VARLSADLRTLHQFTYLGGSDINLATALAIHPTTGEVYVAGSTTSPDFPKTSGGAQASCSSCRIYYTDTFVARLSADLRTLHQSTYLGGNGSDGADAIAIHPKTGEVYVAGYTGSTHFPETFGGAQEIYGGGFFDAFVARLSADLRTLHRSTYLGGSGNDLAEALAIHPTTGEVYVAGGTGSTNFPRTSGGAQASYGGAFVARLSADLRTLHQSTYLGGSKSDTAYALAIHPKTGEVYVAGKTNSTDFPKTSGGAQASKGGLSDAFVTRLNSSLTQIMQSTYLGGSKSDIAYALAIHPTTGEVYVAGVTDSTDFPKTSGGAQTSHGGGQYDAFVARLSADLAAGMSSGSGGGFYMTGSVSSLTGAWSILLLLSVPAFVVARRIRKK